MNKIIYVLIIATVMAILWAIPLYAGEITLIQSIPQQSDIPDKGFKNTLDAWIEMIDGAKQTIDIEVFYIAAKPGHPFDKVIDAIKRAAGRNVKIRIIIDSDFFRQYPEPATSLGATKNISLRLIDYGKAAQGVMHAKMFIVDGKSVFMGSQNFDWRAMDQIHEIGLRVDNAEIASNFTAIFNLDWKMTSSSPDEAMKLQNTSFRPVNAKNPKLLNFQGEKVKIYPAFSPKQLTLKNQSIDEEEIVRLVDGAKSEILLQVMNYTTKPRQKKYGHYGTLDDALRRAAKRGVKVRMIIADWGADEKKLPCLKSLAEVPNIEIRISKIPQHSDGPIAFARVEHCKYMVFDKKSAWIGTSNFEHSYFHNCRNASFIIEGKKPSARLAELFKQGWNSPRTKALDVNSTADDFK